MKKLFSKKLSGFSLIEILVVLMIIGLLTAVVAINVLPSQDRARADKALTDIRIYEQALELYRLDMFSYPTNDEGLQALKQVPANHRFKDRFRQGGYIRKLEKDPWGNDYQYKRPGDNGPLIFFLTVRMVNRAEKVWIEILEIGNDQRFYTG